MLARPTSPIPTSRICSAAYVPSRPRLAHRASPSALASTNDAAQTEEASGELISRTPEPTSDHDVPPNCEPNHAPAFHRDGLTRSSVIVVDIAVPSDCRIIETQ